MSLYLFRADTTQTSTCYEDCAEAWPPLLTEGEPTAGDEIGAADLVAVIASSVEDVFELSLQVPVREVHVAHRGGDVGVAGSSPPTRSACTKRLG